MRGVRARACIRTVVAAACLTGCTVDTVDSARPSTSTAGTTTTASTSTSTSTTTTTTTTSDAPVPPTAAASTSTTSTSTSSTSTTSTTTTVPTPNPAAPASRAAFAVLRSGNAAASLTVLRDGVELVRLAAGATNDGSPMTTDSPMIVASVSKLVTAATVARLAQGGSLSVDDPVPWGAMGFVTDPAWAATTVRELLDHTSGIPVARRSWLDDPGSCADPLATILAAPPAPTRGTWLYSNGNYCALGLLVQHVTAERYDVAAGRLVLGPAGVDGAHLTVDGAWPGDAPYAKGVARFDRLGAAGQWVMSTDDVAALLGSLTAADLEVMRYPGIMRDQYGWGHTGSVDGASACAWIVEDGRTVVAATTSGPRPGSGGGVCDIVVPALAADLAMPYLGDPVRLPD